MKAITERAMRGEIDFIERFRERVAFLKGLDESVMQEIAENLPITEGVDRLMYVLKKYGYKIAITQIYRYKNFHITEYHCQSCKHSGHCNFL